MTKSKEEVGIYLDEARKDAGLTLRQLAEAAEVQLTTLARLLRGEVQEPRPGHLARIADVLEIRASEVFEMAGLPVATQHSSVEALLRTEYALPESAIAEAKSQIDAIVARYVNEERKEEFNG